MKVSRGQSIPAGFGVMGNKAVKANNRSSGDVRSHSSGGKGDYGIVLGCTEAIMMGGMACPRRYGLDQQAASVRDKEQVANGKVS
jgi:hypothetical protein